MLRAAQQTGKWNPGDAANAFVRVILSDAGTMLGGMSDDEWQRILNWFDGRCAYPGEELVEGETGRDHAIPMSRAHCGLHLYGNVLFAIAENDDKKDPEAKNVLREAFAAAGLPAEIEVYAGTLHGWCPPDSAVCHEAQAERAWSRLLALFETALA